MAENQKVDLSTLPKGLTKEEFTAFVLNSINCKHTDIVSFTHFKRFPH